MASITGYTKAETDTLLTGYAPTSHVPSTYVSTNATDETSLVQSFLNGLSAGADALLVGTLNISTITLSVANVRLRMAPGAVLAKIGSPSDVYVSGGTSGPSFTDTLVISAAGVTVEGGSINMPGTWDGTNDGSTGINACSVIRVTGNNCTIRGVTINNVPKNGIILSNVDDAQVHNCRIYGNFPVASYTGTNTGHFGMFLDPPGSTFGGATLLQGNRIASCVQGVFFGNYGAGVGYGYVLSGNTFQGCHNHGIYQDSGDAVVIESNAFYGCQVPIVCTGTGTVVNGNTMYTSTTGGNDDITGISGRDLIDAVITNNTIIGDSTSGSVAIAVENVTGTTLERITLSGNIIDLAGAGGKPAIEIGSSTTQTMISVHLVDNIVRAPGQTGSGVITFTMATGYYGYGTLLSSNAVVVSGNSHGIVLFNQRAARIENNTLRNEYSATTAQTLIHVYLTSVTSSVVRGLTSVNPSGTGANVTLRALEADANSTGNILGPVTTDYETGLAASAVIVDVGTGNLHPVDIGGATAAPTTGTWAAGTRLTNTAPVVGSPKGWLCTVAGTPGTWVSEGNL